MKKASLFRVYDKKCFGLSLPAFGRFKLEFWFICPRYEIKPHSHPNQDIELMLLFGHNVLLTRNGNEKFKAKIWNIFKVFSIPAGVTHTFSVSRFPLIFMNIEKWKVGVKPTSAADDFKEVTNA